VRIVPDPEARNSVLFDAPLFSGSRCPDCPCKDIIPGDGSPHRISPHCIANGGNAIATLHKLFDPTSNYTHRDLALTIQGGKTQKPKLMARLSYTHPKAQMKSSGQTAGVVMSLSNALYAVAEDGRSFSRPAEGLMDHIHAAQARMSRIRRGLRTAIGGCVGHGRGRLYRSIEESRSREAKWTDAENWRIANDLARWCEYAGVRRIVAARWTKNVADLPREVQKIVLRWPRAALLSETAASSSKCEQVLARTGIEVVFSDEPECRCPICSDAPLLPWTPNRVAHCPSCGYERERDYARCVCLLDANDVDVKPVIRKREAEYQAAKTALESPQEEPDEGQEGGLRSSKPRKRTKRSKKSVPS
jgi:hypothetical protein